MWFAFKLYDVDGHGFISKEESLRVLQAGCKESGLRISESALHELNERLFEQADRQGQGILTFEAFQALLMDHSELVGRMTLSSTRLDWADTLNTHQQPKMSRCKRFAALLMKRRWVRRLAALTLWIFNNPQRAFCLLALALVILGTFLWRFIEYALMEKRLALMGWSLPLAKGFGQALKFIWALILFPVCRLAATSLRESWLRHIIPFDDAIYFHKILGVTGLLFAWGHAFCHISNIVRAVDPDRRQLYAEAFPPDPTTWTPTEPTAKAFLSSWVFITGVLMLAILCIAYAFALDWPRKSKRIRDTAIGKVLNNFNNFWLTHHLFILFYALLIMHPLPGKPPEAYDWGQGETWLYIMVPMVLYAAERLIRSARSHARATQVVGAQRLTKDVFMVKVSKPKRFHYSCGHYAFLQCPEISFYEWHPFTISSAPEDECLTFHIRAAGDWTSALAQHIQRALDEPSTEIDKQAASQDIETGEGGSGPTGPPSLARNSAMLLPGLERRSAVLGPRVSPATTNMDDSTLRGPTGRPNLSRMSAPAAVLRDPPAPLPQAEGAQHLATGSSSSGKGRHGSGKRDKKPMMTALPLAPTLRVDGPYGAPTQLHEDYGVLLLIGAGIGVTPFASILHHLVNQFNEHRCSHCGQVNLTKNFPIRKVYFYWTVRDQNAASWFAARAAVH
ncbi:hypothetical protein WJX72_001453 [[Myrmecia] bisecta]|uniref:NADPH oxidase n=1 Tax=[Myrmecia] bisecta TaxID=41462 RepID=A0AAW1P2E0_9CHLO